LAVSHKTFTLTLSRPVPSDFAESKLLILTSYFSWVLRCDVRAGHGAKCAANW
jgi:hypothetical protein